jgi:hypothetical protein
MVAEARRVEKAYVCATTYANGVMSGIAGWFDRYPRIPYGRATSYTAREPAKFAMAYPFLQQLAQGFKDLLPWRYNNQMEAAKKLDPAFLVPETPFTTVTVNKSFRTACHFDAGDFTAGLSNLLTLSNNGNYKGCYLVAPEYRVAVNPRPGDLLLINNHEVMHGNTQIELMDEEAEESHWLFTSVRRCLSWVPKHMKIAVMILLNTADSTKNTQIKSTKMVHNDIFGMVSAHQCGNQMSGMNT